jgi:CubicO group peptidase (beta-lactamase class C family)
MAKGRSSNWLLLTLAGVGLPLLAIPTLWVIVSLTAKPLHKNPANVASVLLNQPLPKWSGAVTDGRRIVRESVAEQNLPGLSVAVGIDGDLVWAEGFGLADIRTNTPVTPNHRFRVGTASTVLTSAAAGLLLEDGALKLDADIQTYVPAFPKKQWPVTVRALMSQTSGLMPDGDEGGPLFTKHCGRTADALPFFASNPLQSQPGTRYRYSNYNGILISAAIEAAANQPFLSFVCERVFDPLGMRDTVPDPDAGKSEDDFPLANMVRELIYDPRATSGGGPGFAKKPAPDRVTPYFTRFASDPNYGMHLMRPLDYSCYAGASVFVATPSDLVRFGMAINSGKLLEPATVKALQTPQRLASGEEINYGLGWQIKSVQLAGKQTRALGHDGDSLGGTVASFVTFPEYAIVVALASNISHADTYPLAVKVAEAFVAR